VARKWRELIPFGCVAAIAVILFFVGIGGGTLEKWDESLYGAAPRFMAEHKSWILPVDGEGKFWGWFGKPPLMPWIVAASTALFGHTTFAVRAPFALFSVGIVLVAYAFGRRADGPATGVLVALATALAPSWLAIGRTASIEIPLIFFLVLSFYLYAWALDRRPAAAAYAGLAFGAAILTKQIMAALGVPVILALELEALRARAVRPALARLVVFGAAVLVASAWWFIYAYAKIGGHLWDEFFGFHVQWRLNVAPHDDAAARVQSAGLAGAAVVLSMVGLWLHLRRSEAWPRRVGVVFAAYLAVSWAMFGNYSKANHPWYYLHDATAMAFGIGALLGQHLRARDPQGWAAGLIAVAVIAADELGRHLAADKGAHMAPVALNVVVIALALRFGLGAILPERWRPRLPFLDLTALAVCLAVCAAPIFAPRPRSDLELVAEALESTPVGEIRAAKELKDDWTVVITYLGGSVKFYDPARPPPPASGPVAYLGAKPWGRPGERRVGKYYLTVETNTP
jgi:4-amino-4-deoxy-L-arabinose transferase-like glycosyltransferase